MDPLAIGGVLATAALLGLTHAVEPDHVAGIAALAGGELGSRRAALAGACFAVGHVALVVAWVIGGYVLLSSTGFPEMVDALGTVVLGAVLSLLGAGMGAAGARSLIRREAHYHPETDVRHTHHVLRLPRGGRRRSASFETNPNHNHPNVDLDPPPGGDPSTTSSTDAGVSHDHGHGPRSYLKLGLIGAVFTLSPPLSMLAFITGVLPAGAAAVGLGVIAYGIAIISAMTVVGISMGAAGRVIRDRGARVHATVQLASGVVIGGFGLHVIATALPV